MRTAGITRKRITTSALTAFAAAVACLLLSPASSSAGSYQVWTAGGIYGGPASCPDVQGPFGSATFIAENRCHQPSGDFGISTGPGEHGPGYRVWELFAPPGTVFASGHVDAHVNSANGDEA